MFDVKPDSRMTMSEQLLYNIWQEIKFINKNSSQRTIEKPTTFQEENKEELYLCKKCDFKTENKGVYLAHCRKHKKEGV
jgi:hypothetical protein